MGIFTFFITLIFSLFILVSPAFAGYCSGNQCLPGPPAPGNQSCASNFDCSSSISSFGTVQPPPGVSKFGSLTSGGLVGFLNVILNLLVILAGLYFLFNLIFAGFGFISAGGDSKAIEAAWGKIWQSIVGLLIVAGSFLLAGVFGYLIFGDPRAILAPTLFGPQ